MTIGESMLPEFDQEMAGTRKTLERVPWEKPDWKPHEKSMPMGRMARMIADMPNWCIAILEKDSLDLAPPGAPPYELPAASSREEIVAVFDRNAAACRRVLAGVRDESLARPWSLL